MKIRITHQDKVNGTQPLIRDLFFCEQQNGRIDLFGKEVQVMQAWITSWQLILDIGEQDDAFFATLVELAAVDPFKQAIQRAEDVIHVEEYRGCVVEKLPNDFDIAEWDRCNYPLSWQKDANC